jgi:hypothetical protein
MTILSHFEPSIRLKRKSKYALVFLLICNSLVTIVGAQNAYAGTFGGSSSVNVTANATRLVLEDLTLTNTSQNYVVLFSEELDQAQQLLERLTAHLTVHQVKI